MAIIRKEDAEGIPAFDFSDGLGEMPQEEEWRVIRNSNSPAPALPEAADHDLEERMDATPAQPQPAPASIETHVPPSAQAAPPVVEVPPEILEQFYEQAVMAGIEEGKSQVLAELGILQERFGAALDRLGQLSNELAAQNRVQLITLACQIAEKLLRDELSTRPERLIQMINEAISQHEGDAEIVVRCSTPDYDYLNQQHSHLGAGTGKSFTVRIQASPELEYGDFQLETVRGNIDGRLSTRIAEVESALTGGEPNA